MRGETWGAEELGSILFFWVVHKSAKLSALTNRRE